MNTYLVAKWLHIVSSLLLVGTGFGSAFYLFCANHFGDRYAKAFATRFVVLADWVFTTPTVLIQPLTGWWLMQQAGWTLDTGWLRAALFLYAFVGACWLPVVGLQIRMQRLATHAVTEAREPGPDYVRCARAWEILGYLGFAGALGLFWLMVFKPDLTL